MQCSDPDPHPPHEWPNGDPGFVWRCPGVRPPAPFASLLYQWDELEALAVLVDREISQLYVRTDRYPLLNALRTSLREAQYQLQPGADESPMVQVTRELLALRRWKQEATEVIRCWEACYEQLDEAGYGGHPGDTKSRVVQAWVEFVLEAGWVPA
jgi:hypothetical protein